jgi:branched-subunit amino acid transport protein AzlD
MLYASIALFALAAVMGLRVITALIQKKDTPKNIVYLHGILAASALVLLIVYSLQNPERYPKTSLIIFILAALGGFYLFYWDMKKKPGPVGIAVIHALAAVTAFVILLLFALG